MHQKYFEIKWDDLTKEAKSEYLKFFKVSEPMEDKDGNLVLTKDADRKGEGNGR